jgi:hypothetical protein
MRPRKKVLLFCMDVVRAGLLRYRMELRHPLRVTVVGTKAELVRALVGREPYQGMVHIVSPNAPNEEVAMLMAAAEGEASRVEVWPEMERASYDRKWSTAHRVIWTDDVGEVCPVIVMAMARKRGPKKINLCHRTPKFQEVHA